MPRTKTRKMPAAKPGWIATYPFFEFDPVIGERHRLHTAYIYDYADIAKAKAGMIDAGHPFQLRWRNRQVAAGFRKWRELNGMAEHIGPRRGMKRKKIESE